jgi:hypothetical protein
MPELPERPSDEVSSKKSSDKIYTQELEEGESAIEYPAEGPGVRKVGIKN